VGAGADGYAVDVTDPGDHTSATSGSDPDVDRRLERAITDLLDDRRAGATICPSEAARRVDPEAWRDLMEPARAAARRLVAAGDLEITQKGAVVDPSTATGPIRLRRLR
jgi:hypothetical protein